MRATAAAALLLLAVTAPAPAEEPAPRPVDALVAELGSKFGKNREQAARELGLHGAAAKAAVPALVAALKDAYAPTRAAAAIALRRIDLSETAGVPVLVAATVEGEDAARLEAVEALAAYPPEVPGVVDALMRLVRSKALGPVALERLRALGPATLPGVKSVLRKGEPDEVWRVWPVVEHLGLDCVPDLLPLLESPDRKTRATAAEHLAKGLQSKYPPPLPMAIEALREGTKSPDSAIEAFAGQGAAGVPALMGILASTESRWSRLQAVRALERVGAEARPAGRLLRGLTISVDREVREAALSALWKADPDAMKSPVRPLDPPPAWMAARAAKDRAKGLRRGVEVEDSLSAALDWLAAHQDPGGRWSCDGFGRRCAGKRCDGRGQAYFDEGATALAVLAFLGAGETHADGRRAEVVRRGLEALVAAQEPDGRVGGRGREGGHWIFNHAAATLALVEAAAATGDSELRRVARGAVHFVIACQNPYMAWRYGVRPQDNDTAVTGWATLALGVARGAGFEVPPECFEGAKTWMDKITEPEHGRAGYTARSVGMAHYEGAVPVDPAKVEGMTALAVVTRLLAGADREDEFVAKGQDLVAKSPPLSDPREQAVDFHYWHFGSLALRGQVSDRKRSTAQAAWQAAAVGAILESQRLDRAEHRFGSWDPVDPWSFAGGRVYATAIHALTLQTPWRYPKEWFTGR